jgi:hypothetical protein
MHALEIGELTSRSDRYVRLMEDATLDDDLA